MYARIFYFNFNFDTMMERGNYQTKRHLCIYLFVIIITKITYCIYNLKRNTLSNFYRYNLVRGMVMVTVI